MAGDFPRGAAYPAEPDDLRVRSGAHQDGTYDEECAVEQAPRPLYDLPAETMHLTLANERLEARYVAKDQTDATIAFICGGISTHGPRYQCAKFDAGPGLQLWPCLAYEDLAIPVPGGVFLSSNTSVVLYKAVDGSLVVRLQAESGFTMLLVPYIRTDSEWLRFGGAPHFRKRS